MEITDRLRDLGSNVSEDLTPIEIAEAKMPEEAEKKAEIEAEPTQQKTVDELIRSTAHETSRPNSPLSLNKKCRSPFLTMKAVPLRGPR